MSRRKDGREVWSRLLNWDKGQTPSERLACQILLSQEYLNLDPSHPLGGKDGGKDVFVTKDEIKLVAGVYFARGQNTFKEIKSKFKEDLKGVIKNNAKGFVFVTNQELRLGERTELVNLGNGMPVEIYHLERIATILNSPENYGTRLEFLDIEMTREEIIALYEKRDKAHLKQLAEVTSQLKNATETIIGYNTGGDSFPIVHIQIGHEGDRENLDVMVVVRGDFPLFDTKVEVLFLNSPFNPMKDGKWDPKLAKLHFAHQKSSTRTYKVGTITSSSVLTIGKIKCPEKLPTMVSLTIYTRFKRFFQTAELDNDGERVRLVSAKISEDHLHKNILQEWGFGK